MEILVHPDITEDVSGYVEEIKKNNPDKVLKSVEISPADDGESVTDGDCSQFCSIKD